MNKLLVILMVVAASFMANSAQSQVRVNAQIGVGTPGPVVYERDYPGYTYYSYPAWHGHYRDRYYYAHYRPVFEREHRTYFHGRSFDHERYERERGSHGHGGDHRN